VSADSESKRILIVRLSSLGDVIQTLPMLAAIRHSFPHAVIGWAIDAELVAAIAGHPELDTIHPCPRHGWRTTRWPRMINGLLGFAAEIRAARYDIAIDAQGLLVSAVIPFMAGIKRRIGFGHRRELSHLFYTEKYISSSEYFASDRHHSEHMLALARALGCETGGCQPSLPEVPSQVRTAVNAMLDRAFGGGGAVIAIAPGTRWTSKHWPVEFWSELVNDILRNTAANIVLIGSRSEAAIADQLLQAQAQSKSHRVLNLAGKTSLLELFALLGRVPVTIAPDSAPLHIAGAAGCAHLIGIYGPTPGTRTGPLGAPDIRLLSSDPQLSCQPCRRPRCRYGTNQCMRNVAPAQVLAALQQALGSPDCGIRQLPKQ
jgi:heptosyltransferase-1